MSVTYISYAILGCPFDDSVLLTEVKVKAFPHNHDESINFDPITGKPLWIIEDRAIDGYDGDCEYLDFKIIRPGEYSDGQNYIAVKVAMHSSWKKETRLDISDYENDKAKLKAVLEPLGQWDEDEFGVYCVQYIS